MHFTRVIRLPFSRARIVVTKCMLFDRVSPGLRLLVDILEQVRELDAQALGDHDEVQAEKRYLMGSSKSLNRYAKETSSPREILTITSRDGLPSPTSISLR